MSDSFLDRSFTLEDQSIGDEKKVKLSGLSKIYLYNSFFKRRFVKVDCLGNTNNTGSNGAGKTSLLSLIPIFYGAEPNTVVSREANKLSFVQYYLPSQDSMIAFEYLKQGESRFVVLYSQGESLYYRFVACDALTLFCDESISELKRLNDTREWLKTFVAKQVRVSPQLNSTVDYRCIIQNTRRRLLKSQHNHLSLAPLFSLCDTKNEIYHMGALTSIMIKNSRLLEQLKTMLVDCYLGNTIHLEVPSVDKNNLQIETLRAMIRLNQEEKTLRKAIHLKEDLFENRGKLLFASEFARDYQVELTNNFENKKDLIKELKLKLKELDNQYSAQSGELKSKILSLTQYIEELEQNLNKIQKQKDEWDDKNIESLIALYENRFEYEEKAHNAKVHYETLSDSANQLISEFESTCQKKESLYYKNRDKLREDSAELEKSLKVLEDDLAKEREGLTLKLDKDRENLINERIDDKQNLNNEIIALTSQVAKDERPSAQEMTKCDELSQKINENELNIKSVQDKLNLAYRDIRACEHDLKQSLKDLDDKQNILRERKIKIEEITQKLYPKEGSLLKFLESNLPSWKDNIGLVIREDLLDKTDLKPFLLDKSHESIMGLSLDLNVIDKPEYLKSTEELERARKEQSLLLNVDEKEQQKLKAKYEAKKSKFKELEILIGNLQSSLSSYQKERENLKVYQKNLNNEIIENAQIRSLETRKKLDLKKKILGAFDGETSKLKTKLVERYKDYDFELKALYAQKKSPILEQISQKVSQLTKLKNTYEEQLAEIKKAHDLSLKNQGLDPVLMRKARENYLACKDEYEKILSSKKEIDDYKDFIENIFSTYETKLKEQKNNSEILATTNILLEKQCNEYKILKDKLNSEIDTYQKEEEYTKDELNKLDSLFENIINPEQKKLKNQSKIPVSSLVKNASLIKDTIKSIVQDCQEQATQIKNSLDDVERITTQVGLNNQISHYWQNLIEERDEKFCHIRNMDFYLSCVDDLKRLLDEIIPLNLETVVETVRTTSAAIFDFYNSLKSFNNRVGRLSSEFGKKLNLDNPFNSISDIQIELLSKVDEFDIWTDLKAYAKIYTEYEDMGKNNKIPSTEFLAELERTNDALKNCHISDDIKSLVDLKISMKENGRLVQIRSDNDLQGLSSRGLSKIAIIVIFCGLTRYLCSDKSIRINWPIDELGELHEENVVLLFKLMNDNNIVLFSAQPNPSLTLLQYFDTKNYVNKDEGVKLCVDTQISEDNPLFC